MGTSALLAAACALAGCSDGTSVSEAPGGNEPERPPAAELNMTRLRPVGSEQAFFDAWRAALASEYERYANGPVPGGVDAGGAETDAPAAPSPGSDAGTTTSGDAAGGSTDGGISGTADSPSAGESAGAPVGNNNGGDDSNDFTTTNVQEQGVDEADLVKNDGQFLYILQQGFGGGGCPECGATDGGGTTGGADFADDTSEPGTSPAPQSQALLRILALQPDVPDSSAIAELPLDLRGGYTNGMFLHRKDDARSVLIASSGFNGYYDQWNNSRAFAGRQSTLSRIDVSNPQAGTTTSALEFDGQVVSSRRVDDNLIIASRFYPDLDGLDPYAYPSDEAWLAALEDVDLNAALPRYTRLSDGAAVPMVNPANCFVADTVAEGGSWPDIITLSVFNANDLSLTSSACYLGASETLYASPDAVFLATTRWNYYNYPQPEFDDVAAGQPYQDPRIDTDIHQFDLSGNQLLYAGSGRVPGHLGWNELRKPFRMSEKDGDLRVATMADTQSSEVSPVNLTILRADGTGDLRAIGALPNGQRPEHIGKPGEQLYASRFLGNRGYLVTFRQTDPLYVLELSNPSDPYLAGELEVEGYSDYLHPIDDNWLLGIGMDAITANNGQGDGRGGIVQGVKVSLYDVSDPAEPREVSSKLLGQRGTYSTALNDHRAITILPPANGRVATRVAFGIDIAGTPEPARRPEGDDAWNYNEWRFNALHGLEIRTGADAGITLTGTLVAADRNQPGYAGGDGVERSVMVGDSVYYVYGSRVRAASWNAFDNPSPAR